MNTWGIAPSADEVIGIAENAVSISALVSLMSLALKRVESLDPIWELCEKCPSVGRAVVQLPVRSEFFHAFFNSSNSYRAMFRRGPRIGSAANSALVASVNELLSDSLPEAVGVHLIEFGPKWAGRSTVSKSDFLRSLDPSLAKVWYSTAEIRPNGEVRLMPAGVSSEKIDVGLKYYWTEIHQNPEDCIFEVKGAFVGPYGLFQLKDPELRAYTLFSKGEA